MDAANKLFDEMPGRNAVSWNAMIIAGYARSGDGESSASLFRHMTDKNLISWTIMICCYSQNGLFREALETFDAMRDAGVSPDKITMCSVISACAHLGALEPGRRMRRLIALYDFSMDVYIGSALVDMYAKAGDMDAANKLFDEMPGRNAVSWNAMIIAGYARSGDGESSASLFRHMTDKNLISWTIMICCYSQNGLFREALETFDAMRDAGVSPDKITMCSVISACAHLGALEPGKRMRRLIALYDFFIDVYIGSALVDMYAKCGCIERSLVLFFKLKEKNLFSYAGIRLSTNLQCTADPRMRSTCSRR
ncbi:Pentatricopeptide repeat-containing protein [Platanthera guangdongensis]|uniref:Pentatricopeptide repeat-containing protein n=1 Tax=Platanthera guangdongensis TaxID=2320717 RepID=A0ABR2M410_9ASPA